MRYILSICIIVSMIFGNSANVFCYTDKDALNKEEKSLEEILAEEKTKQYGKIDDFLSNFDKDYTKDIGEKFEDLLEDDTGTEADEDEISTDSFEEFNVAFDKMIEEDLAAFELVDINAEDLESGLDSEEPSTSNVALSDDVPAVNITPPE
ncbi:MAG: hypothetical protein JW938_02055 [Candidatus Omnitrophica bacterium]|nr:hypothetical protein [Candidatus Omnitrophota bacterium]